jgi:hypothetical protein
MEKSWKEVEKMKKILLLLILVGILLIDSVKITEASATNVVIDAVALKTTFVNQDPYPAEPGAYVNLLFKVENWGTKNAENVVFELLPEYPFSLDSGVDATKELGTIRGLETGEKAYFLKYKVRVDKDAINGENEIKINYKYGTGAVQSTETFNVTVSNPKTDFDVVAQDSTAASTTLAIANIGANDAYSVIVRIPNQGNFRVTGASASVIGNLNAGDYTLVSFQITLNTGIANISSTGGNIPPIRSFNRTSFNISMAMGGNLAVEISYTDTLGIRRTVQKEVRLDTSGISETSTRARLTQGSQFQIPSGGLMYIGIGVVGIIVIVAFFKIRKRKKK